MKYFLAKTEPSTYSIDDLEKEGVTMWNGVKNPQAIIFIKQMKVGDRLFIYHSGGETAVVGLAEVIGAAEADPKIPKSWMMKIKYLKTFSRPVTLKEIKESGEFDDFRLVYQGRLSTMDVPEKFVKWIEKKLK
ncbi:EVE domain-containing protein [Candidatus Peregrinibacteria bacterium]|nr:EVE domain-containing protein [Candidatus Peregrinibacteria bacterium]